MLTKSDKVSHVDVVDAKPVSVKVLVNKQKIPKTLGPPVLAR